jgi:ABC-2 type transport system ATP-binding protein
MDQAPTPEQQTYLLAVTGLTKTYAGRPVIDDLDISVEPGSALALVGPNGCGKSTVLRCLSGHERAEHTSVQCLGRTATIDSAVYRAQVFPVFDDFSFFPDLTVREHLEFLGGVFGVTDGEASARSALEMFGIAEVAEHFPAILSSGQIRRVAFASASIRTWNVLLLDEPEQRLDQDGRDRLIGFLRTQLLAGRGLIFATHDLDLVRQVNARKVSLAAPG